MKRELSKLKKGKRIVVIYHGECFDGFGGAWAAWKKFGDRASYIPAFDRVDPPHGVRGKEVYLIDYTYPAKIIHKLIARNRSVTAIDHHISAEAAVKLTDRKSVV